MAPCSRDKALKLIGICDITETGPSGLAAAPIWNDLL